MIFIIIILGFEIENIKFSYKNGFINKIQFFEHKIKYLKATLTKSKKFCIL